MKKPDGKVNEGGQYDSAMVSRAGTSAVHTRHFLLLRKEIYSVGKRVALYPQDCLTVSLHQLLAAEPTIPSGTRR